MKAVLAQSYECIHRSNLIAGHIITAVQSRENLRPSAPDGVMRPNVILPS
jgi:aconitase A